MIEKQKIVINAGDILMAGLREQLQEKRQRMAKVQSEIDETEKLITSIARQVRGILEK